MKKRCLGILLVIVISTFTLWAEVLESSNIFLVKQIGDEVSIDKIELKNNEFKLIQDENLITYIPVFAAGSKSGDLVDVDHRISGLVAGLVNGNIIVKAIKPDGSQKEMPSIEPQLGKELDIRINVTGANGFSKAILIQNYINVKVDNGPVLDMFGGTIPLNPGDFSFMFEFTEAKGGKAIEGEIPYIIDHDWIVVDCTLANEKIGRFVVDFGAATTFIPKTILPAGTEIEKFKIVEYSAEGVKESEGVTQGATGMVENIVGNAVLEKFQLGSIMLPDFKVQVLNDFPKPFLDLNISGVLGRDVLMKTDIVQISNLSKDAEKKLIFSKKDENFQASDLSIPFNFAGGGKIYIDGKIQGVPQHFFFDSGSALNSIPKQFLDDNNIHYKVISASKKLAFGIDGKGVESDVIELENITIGSIKNDTMEFDMQSVFALEKTGSGQETALLGMNFLNNYNNIIFDFVTNEINLQK